MNKTDKPEIETEKGPSGAEEKRDVGGGDRQRLTAHNC